ncbi:MAG: DUF6677 family protein [Planctomycetota bacterium]
MPCQSFEAPTHVSQSSHDPPIELKNAGKAALLAWLVPGLGHLYQGRVAKGVIFCVSITSLFVFGFILGSAKVTYAATVDVLPSPKTFVMERWPFPCQAGIGAVAIPCLVERARYRSGAQEGLVGGAFFPPRTGIRATTGAEITSVDNAGNTVKHPNELAKWQYDGGYYFELGTIYTVVAGLLNLLVVYDAGMGPLVQLPTGKPKQDTEDSAARDAAKNAR